MSAPVYCPQDEQTLPEVISSEAWAAMLEQVRAGSKPIGLCMRHAGEMLACTSLRTLRLEVHPVLGGMFEAELEDAPLERLLLNEIGLGGIGVSLAFRFAKLAHERRDGQTVRVVSSCVADHISLVRKSSGERAVYAAARAFAVQADRRDRLPAAWRDARTESWRLIRGTRG